MRYPTSRISTRVDMYYACNVKLGKEGEERILPLFARSGHYDELKSPSKQYLEEDRSYIPLRMLTPVVVIEDLALICAPTDEVWTIKKEYVKTKYDGTLWDVDANVEGTLELACRKTIDEQSGRADSAYQPRVPRIPRFVNFRELPANVCLRDGPLILGLHETVIPIPRDLSPGFGVAREIFLMFPELKEAIITNLGKRRVGDAVVCKIRTGYHSAHLYMPMSRESTCQLPCFEPFDQMMRRILQDARKREINHLTVLRAPGKPYADSWEDAVKYYSRGFWNTPVIGLVLRGIAEPAIPDYPGNSSSLVEHDQECPGLAKINFKMDRH